MDDYTPEDKKIFQYFQGTKKVWGDPMALRRELILAEPTINQLLKDWYLPEQLKKHGQKPKPEEEYQAEVAEKAIVAAVRIAFNMPCHPESPDKAGYGATEEECVAAIQSYLDFNKKKGTNIGALPTSSSPPTSSPSKGTTITKPTTVSSST